MRPPSRGAKPLPFQTRTSGPDRETEGADGEFLRSAARRPEAAWGRFQELYLPVVYGVIRLFADSYDERMDLFVFVSEKLREDGMRRVRAYRFRPEAPCTFRSYLAVVVRNLALDFVRSTRGRYRPFKQIAGLSGTDRLIFDYHLKERRPLAEVAHLLEAKHGVRLRRRELRQRSERIESSLSDCQRWRLLSRVWAGRRPLPVDPVDGATTATGGGLALRSAGKDPEAELDSESARTAFREALAGIEPRKRLALALRYKDGLKVREVARVMRATEKQVEHWVREAVTVIREHLVRSGFTRDDLDPDQLTGLLES
jgi:RNA polymerase sigma factor (sigma-70 family)